MGCLRHVTCAGAEQIAEIMFNLKVRVNVYKPELVQKTKRLPAEQFRTACQGLFPAADEFLDVFEHQRHFLKNKKKTVANGTAMALTSATKWNVVLGESAAAVTAVVTLLLFHWLCCSQRTISSGRGPGTLRLAACTEM